ncbi:MAG: hypothetical protein JNK85_24775 [Verrucomicrobiales bacterium]|nr:hypothetical protein [Verrucomicrobiales bacterium]
MESPTDLFGHPQDPSLVLHKGGLVIGTSKASRLSKAQQKFNRLVGRIEKIRRHIESTQSQLDQHLAFYGAALHPLEEKIAAHRKEFVQRLHPFLAHRELRVKSVRNRLKRLISHQLQMLLDYYGDLDSPELETIYKTVQGKTLDESDREELESTRAQMQDLCDFMGIDMDLSEIKEGISEEQLNRKFEELEARLNAAQGQAEFQAQSGGSPRREKPKSKRQLEREARDRAAEELRTRDIGRLYKQLAKLLHPDLEPDAARRQEKEAAMKRLTTAYKDGDLHTMLRLEVEWILQEQADANRLTDEKLAIYNDVLKEQVFELEEELRNLSSHPRYQPLHRFKVGFALPQDFDGEKGRQKLLGTLADIQRSVTALGSESGLAEVQDLLKAFAAREEHARQMKRMGFDWD